MRRIRSRVEPHAKRTPAETVGLRPTSAASSRVFASVTLAVIFLVPLCGNAQPGSHGEELEARSPPLAYYERWSAAGTFSINLLRQEVHGRGVSSRRPRNQEGTPQYGSKLLVEYAFGLAFDVMAPSIADVPGQPQPVAFVEVSQPLGLEIDAAREGSPNGFMIPELPPSGDSDITEVGVGGQGLKTEAEYRTPALVAGIGVSFSADGWGERFRFRPSIQYLMQRVELDGTVLDADGRQLVESGVVIEDFSLLTLRATGQKTIHGLGGGLEVEIDVLRGRRGTLSMLAGIHAYRIIGNRSIQLSASDGTDTATWGATFDPVVYRGNVGFRYRFDFP